MVRRTPAGSSRIDDRDGDVPPRQPTLDEVAGRAGVSRAGASRVINNVAAVSAAQRAAVDRAVRELGHL
ncbi:hypothetical protein VM98_35460, partial [Streptomyces rubellomurinus subsp. indigoferus]